MKAKLYLPTLTLFLFTVGCHQAKESDLGFNLGFEIAEYGAPKGWLNCGDSSYNLIVDSWIKHTGRYSLRIESTSKTNIQDFGCLAFLIPAKYKGENITLKAFMRTKGVDSPIGLLLRIDGESRTLQFDNMQQKGIKGSKKWEEYLVTLPLPQEAKTICIGAILSGKGKLWIDDFQVLVDGVDIKDYEPKLSPAELDKELSNSNISIPLSSKNLASREAKTLITNLELLGKLWGFLKYHHPEVGKGNYNWDNELFRMLPEYVKAQGSAQRDEILLQWIEKYGEISTCETCKEISADAFLKPDLSWIEKFSMSAILKDKIREIYRNRHQGDHFYVRMKNEGNPIFSNENSYPHMHYSDAGLRLLALYRYWNMIQYFFPYKYLTDKNWNEILKEYIPRFVLAKTELEYQLAVLLLTGEINDTHTNLTGVGDKIDSLRGNWQAPYKVGFVENKLVVIDYYKSELKDSTSLNVGDVITHVNGKKIEYIVDSIKIYYPASNEAVRMKNLANDLVRSRSKTLFIDYTSSSQSKQTMEQTLYDRKNLNMNKKDNGKSYKLLYDNLLLVKDYVGYITLKHIKASDIDKIKSEFKDTKGIIIDIRNYPNTFVPFLLGSYFVSENTPFVQFSKGNLNNPGEFTLKPALEISKIKEPYQGKLVVMVNEETLSRAEYTAMAFRAGSNTTIIGSQTAGADGDVSKIDLPGGLTTWISGIGVYYPDGRGTQRIGIVPDIEVKPTIQGIREGRDEILEKAIEIIRKQ